MYDKKAVKKYALKNKELKRALQNKYYHKHRKKINARNLIRIKGYYDKCLKEWLSIIPKETKCEICGKSIIFNAKDRNKAIHFDHKMEGEEQRKISPSMWLGARKCNEKNRRIWEECCFGMLCKNCNSFLPTKNRKQFIHQVIRYMGWTSWKEGDLFTTS